MISHGLLYVNIDVYKILSNYIALLLLISIINILRKYVLITWKQNKLVSQTTKVGKLILGLNYNYN